VVYDLFLRTAAFAQLALHHCSAARRYCQEQILFIGTAIFSDTRASVAHCGLAHTRRKRDTGNCTMQGLIGPPVAGLVSSRVMRRLGVITNCVLSACIVQRGSA
jgi:hypothetical protein